MTIMYIILTCPAAIGGGYFLSYLFSNPQLNILYIMDIFSFSYHAFSFLIFSMANKRLNCEIKSLLRIEKKIPKVPVSTR